MNNLTSSDSGNALSSVGAPGGSSVGAPGGPSGLLDLDDIFGGGPPSGSPPGPGQAATQESTGISGGAAGGMDLLADVFSGSASISSPTPNAPSAPAPVPSDGGLLGDLMGGSSASNATPPQPPVVDLFGGSNNNAPAAPSPAAHAIQAFDKGGLTVFMELSKPNINNNAYTGISFKFRNSTSSPMQNISFQAAVPKYLKLEMHPPNSTVIPANSYGEVSQDIGVTNSMQGQKSIVLKLKIGYNIDGRAVDEMATVSNFPALY